MEALAGSFVILSMELELDAWMGAGYAYCNPRCCHVLRMARPVHLLSCSCNWLVERVQLANHGGNKAG